MIPLHLLVRRPESSDHGTWEFLSCIGCEDVHRLSRLDTAPAYDGDGNRHRSDDLRAFLLRHTDHPLSILQRASDVEVHSHARHDPMCRVSWEAADAEGRRFVVTLGREDVESPRRYTIRTGRLVPVAEAIELDSSLLHAVVDEALYPHAAPSTRLAWLIQACRSRVSSTGWEQFEPIDEDRDDPNTQLACLPAAVACSLAADARREFGGCEGERVAELLQQELRFEIPVVRLRRQYVVEAG